MTNMTKLCTLRTLSSRKKTKLKTFRHNTQTYSYGARITSFSTQFPSDLCIAGPRERLWRTTGNMGWESARTRPQGAQKEDQSRPELFLLSANSQSRRRALRRHPPTLLLFKAPLRTMAPPLHSLHMLYQRKHGKIGQRYF